MWQSKGIILNFTSALEKKKRNKLLNVQSRNLHHVCINEQGNRSPKFTMLSGHVMFTALVPYGSLSLPLFALRWIKLISLALDTGQSESIGGDMRSKSGIIQNSRFSKIVFLISRVHHQCYSSVSPLRAQNASTTSFVSRSHWGQSSQANNQYCPFLL